MKRKHQGYDDTFFIDEAFVRTNGKQHYLWRAVDQNGDVVDVFRESRRDGAVAKRFFKRFLRSHSDEPRRILTDRSPSYGGRSARWNSIQAVLHQSHVRLDTLLGIEHP